MIEFAIAVSLLRMNCTAVYAGSFDPMTLGHLDVIQRVAPLFDKLYLLVARNSTKTSLFDVEERKALLEANVSDLLPKGSYEIEDYEGLTVNYCEEKKAKVLIRGIRALSDFEKEFQMATMNRHLNRSVESLHVMTDEKYFFVSSSLVKEIAAHGGPLSHLVPKNVEEALKKKYRSRNI